MRKFVRRIFVLCVLTVVQALSPNAVSQEKPAEAEKLVVKAQWEIIAECQMIVLPQKAALPLIPDLSDDAKIETAFASLQQMISRGEATLVATLVARGVAGKTLISESIEEFRYPTEYDPPQLPANVPAEKALEILKAWPVVGITPTAFETRNLGATVQLITAVSNDGQWIAVDAVPEHTRFIRFTKYDGGILPSGERLSVEQPQISSLKNTLSLQVRSGQRVLVGIHKVPAEDNVMELFFLRIRTQKTGATP